jgi:hypothetical protein
MMMNAEQIQNHIAGASLPVVKKASQNWKVFLSSFLSQIYIL